MPGTQTQSSAEKSPDVSQLLSVLERLVEEQVRHVNIVTKQEQHLSALRKQRQIQLTLDPKYIQFQNSREKKREIRGQWHNEILKWDSLENWPPDDEGSLHDILSAEQLWTTWQYRAAYPNSARFLEKATTAEKSLSLVYYDSFFQTGEVNMKWSSEVPYAKEIGKKVSMPERMWDIVKRRIVADRPDESGKVRERLPSRLLRIVDISPVVATILLASTPKNVVSNISPFLERYLTFSNFGKASMQSIKSKTMNSFIFEYHFAFYYVTKHSLETHLAFTDVRKLRKFSRFGQRADNDTCSRHIYEEQMSFILTGHGHDIYTCYQLGEKYFNGPLSGEDRTFVSSPTWTPPTLFLSWIAMALHHVGIRWQDAITAVDSQIASEEAVVFHQMDSFDMDSGAKDLKISTLRTYFWALEVYKLFEDKLEATVSAWEQFKRCSLDKVNDGRNSEDFSKSVELIDLAIDRLREKTENIRKKSEQVLRLRDGLFYVTSLSDTSVTIHQGENIKLLTYFTLLFLPLSFSTSIFGMQILPKTIGMKTFTIVLPVVTVSTVLAVFVLTGAVQEIQKVISENISSPGQKLRRLMLAHPRRRWEKKQLGCCTYIAFLAELCFISIPIHEVKRAVEFYGSINRYPAQPSNLHGSMSLRNLRSNTTLTSDHMPTSSDGEASAKSRARQVIELQLAEKRSSPGRNILLLLRQARAGVFITVRILLLCFWIPLLLLEYLVLLFCCPFTEVFRTTMQPDPQRRTNKGEQLKRFFAAPFLLVDFDLCHFRTWERRARQEHRSPAIRTEATNDPSKPFPQSYFYPDPASGNRRSGPGREPHLRGAVRHLMARPTFQAAIPSASSPVVVPAQLSTHLQSQGYSDAERGILRRTGGAWIDSERGFSRA